MEITSVHDDGLEVLDAEELELVEEPDEHAGYGSSSSSQMHGNTFDDLDEVQTDYRARPQVNRDFSDDDEVTHCIPRSEISREVRGPKQ